MNRSRMVTGSDNVPRKWVYLSHIVVRDHYDIVTPPVSPVL